MDSYSVQILNAVVNIPCTTSSVWELEMLYAMALAYGTGLFIFTDYEEVAVEVQEQKVALQDSSSIYEVLDTAIRDDC